VTDTTTATWNAVRRTIEERRSIGRVLPETPPRELIEAVLEAATWAPNHRLTEPWRFTVIAGSAREELGRLMAEQTAAKFAEDDPKREVKRAGAAQKPLRAPVIVAVAVEPVEAAKVVEIEEVTAGAAAIQNMLLAAHALGLGAIWRTGDACYSPDVKRWLGISERGYLLGLVYLGYPDMTTERSKRTPSDELTTWLGWDEPAGA
jgi:nitroreductase